MPRGQPPGPSRSLSRNTAGGDDSDGLLSPVPAPSTPSRAVSLAGSSAERPGDLHPPSSPHSCILLAVADVSRRVKRPRSCLALTRQTRPRSWDREEAVAAWWLAAHACGYPRPHPVSPVVSRSDHAAACPLKPTDLKATRSKVARSWLRCRYGRVPNGRDPSLGEHRRSET